MELIKIAVGELALNRISSGRGRGSQTRLILAFGSRINPRACSCPRAPERTLVPTVTSPPAKGDPRSFIYLPHFPEGNPRPYNPPLSGEPMSSPDPLPQATIPQTHLPRQIAETGSPMPHPTPDPSPPTFISSHLLCWRDLTA